MCSLIRATAHLEGAGGSQAGMMINGANLKELDSKPAPVSFAHRESHMNSSRIEPETEVISTA
jgi:hypothetical protein